MACRGVVAWRHAGDRAAGRARRRKRRMGGAAAYRERPARRHDAALRRRHREGGLAAARAGPHARRLAQAPEETQLAFLGQLDAGPDSPGEPPLAVKLWRQLAAAPGFTPAGLDAGLAYLEAADLAPQWARIAAFPAAERPRLLWLHGANDRVCPRAAMERARASFGPGLRTAVLPDAGHAPFLSHPEAWREEVSAWHEGSTDDRGRDGE
ncbi:alpha/beta fold hydrolase [Paenibacillus melissococcoides]|uniref:alpha/beta fold hydrolase n=1 Tax=Paenibacillus melissococcoides TaxID=2912268 RepID=UPI0038B26214